MREKAILFLEFREKVEIVHEVKSLGYKVVLVTKKALPLALEVFDEVIECDLSDRKNDDALIKQLPQAFDIQGIVCNYEAFVIQKAYLAQKLGLPSSSIYAACCSRNKAMQRQELNGVPENVPSRVVETWRQAQEAYRVLGPDVYLKSLSGIKSRFIFSVQTEEALQDSWQLFQHAPHDHDLFEDFSEFGFDFRYPDPKKILLIEQACHGFQVALTSFVNDAEIVHAPSLTDTYSASSLGFPDTFLAFRMLPSRLAPELIDEAQSVVEKVTRALKLQYCGLHTELILTDSGEWKVVEIASRIGGYRPLMYREAYGLNITRQLVQAILGQAFVSEFSSHRKYVSLMEVFPRQGGFLVEIEGLDELRQDPSVSRLMEKKKQGDPVGLAKEGHPPVLTFLISGDDYEEVYHKSVRYQRSLSVITK
ncbi:MAG: ATP-grasp domain-containing protein [Candidatus Altimarinota bacterium]